MQGLPFSGYFVNRFMPPLISWQGFLALRPFLRRTSLYIFDPCIA